MFTIEELQIIKTCLHEAIMDGNGTPEMGALMLRIVMMVPADEYEDEEEDTP